MKSLILGMFLSLMLALPSQVSRAQVNAQAGTEQVQEVKQTKNKIFGFLKDINALNIVLIGFGTFAGGLWFKGRTKLKQLADLFQKAYEYTDDKRLSEEERIDLLNRFLELLGKKGKL